MGIAECVPHMQEELERLRANVVELTRGFSTMKEGLVHKSDFLELRSMVGRYEAEIAGLQQARLDTPCPTFSRGPTEGSRVPVPVYSGEPIRDVGMERVELDNAHGREGEPVYCCIDRTGEGDRTR